MINRKHRFHGHGSLRFVYQRGETIRGQYGALKVIRNPRRKTYRMAVVVSRKVHKSAVVRNRIRRRIYEIVRTHESLIEEPWDIVCTVYSDQLAEMESAQLQKQLIGQLQKAGIMSGRSHASLGHAIVETKEKL
jgi:ribonuclease P protein component